MKNSLFFDNLWSQFQMRSRGRSTRVLFLKKKSPAGAVDRAKTDPTATAAPKAAAASKLQEAARGAKNSVEQGKYRTAEKQYQQILATDPSNLGGALSGSVSGYFRTGNIRAAESTLKKALTIAPNDDFVLTTLGILHYQQCSFYGEKLCRFSDEARNRRS